MNRSNLLATHRAALGPVATRFAAANDADLLRHLDQARRMLAEKHPRILPGAWTVQAGMGSSSAPAGFLGLHRLTWGLGCTAQPWEPGYPGPVPRLRSLMDPSGGGYMLWLEPAPTALQIAVWGASVTYEYRALHVLADDDTHTLPDAEAPVLLLAALIVAMRELATRGTVDPVQMHRGVGSTASAQTPAEVLRLLQDEWRALP